MTEIVHPAVLATCEVKNAQKQLEVPVRFCGAPRQHLRTAQLSAAQGG